MATVVVVPKTKTPVTFDEHVGATVAAYLRERGKRQEDMARATHMSLTTVGRKIRGQVEFTASELTQVAAYVDSTVGEILERALSNYGGLNKLLSEVGGTPTGIRDELGGKGRSVADLTTEDIDNYAGPMAASGDPEIGQPEPDSA